jgi:hypothetical protein
MSIFIFEAFHHIDDRGPDSREKSLQCIGDLLYQTL